MLPRDKPGGFLSNVDNAYTLATQSMVCNMMTDVAAEGFDAFAAKRKPVWRGK